MKKQFTKQSLEKFKKDLTHLKNIERKEISERIKKAAAYGDLSENAEYTEAKEAQAFLEGKIMEMQELIESAVVVSGKGMRGVVQIGSTILLQSKFGKEKIQIVGLGDVSPLEGKISPDSPMGKTLINKPIGAIISIEMPKGKINYKILKIE